MILLQNEIEKKYQNSVAPGGQISIQTQPYKDNLHPNGDCYHVTISFPSKRLEYVVFNKKSRQFEYYSYHPNIEGVQIQNKQVSFSEFWRRYENGQWGCTRDGND